MWFPPIPPCSAGASVVEIAATETNERREIAGEGSLVSQFLVERYLPGMNLRAAKFSVARVTEQADRMAKEESSVARVHSAFVPSEEYMVCIFEAPSVELVREVNNRAGFPYDRVVEVIVVTPDGDTSDDRVVGSGQGR